jgi:FAD/FMN-containing dehydrogenase/Fe-S oxidoreductase
MPSGKPLDSFTMWRKVTLPRINTIYEKGKIKHTEMTNNQALQASQEFIVELGKAVQDVRFDPMTRILYSTDASIYQMMPVGVAIPKGEDEVTAAVETAGKHGVPILPRGNGSSLAGQAVGHALVLDLSRHLDQVLEIDAEARSVRVQPGITLGLLNRILNQYGLMYGPDPASADRATMGGILGNNSTGAHSILYGMTVDHVLSAKVVLSDASTVLFDSFEDAAWASRGKRPGLEGAIYNSTPNLLKRYEKEIATKYPKTFRHVAGYNLNQIAGSPTPNMAKLIVGSEGTLGIITEATLNLVPTLKVKGLAMVHFSDFREALKAVPHILESDPSAIEILDKMLLDLTRNRIEYRRLLTFIEGDPESVLMVEFAGDSELEIEAGLVRLKEILNRLGHNGSVVIVTDPAEQANVWYVRKVGLGILMSIRGDAKPIPFVEDAAVPVEHLADYITRLYDFAYSTGVEQVAVYAHASAGCMHVRPLVNLKNADGIRQLRQIGEESVRLVLEYGGTTSGEHGEGLARGEFSEMLFGPELAQAFRQLKETFDPTNIMNPGKVVNTPRMDDETYLRFGRDYALPQEPRSTVFSFELDEGFSGAVEMCNGAGVCRRLAEGVMCPSFQVTRDEADSTRGRANALRAAMMGHLGPNGMTSEEVYSVLDLCLSCKACEAECPSAVDMAKLKAEFQHGYYEEHGIPLRSNIFGNIARVNRLGQPFAPLANSILKGPGKWALEKLGVARERSFPELADQSFSKWHRGHRSRNGAQPDAQKQVVFFHDTFMEHNHPEVGRAAWKVLEAVGFEPILLDKRECCGRPAVSKGLLNEAARLAKHNINLLAPYARDGIPILGCEPSCITMLVDEYPSLVPGDDAAAVAKMAMPIEQFLEREITVGNVELTFDDLSRKVLFHGHCHQKAIFGVSSTLSFLRRIPNCEVEEVDSGCCGMAGSFGYEAEHYDLSIQLTEMTLAPAVRTARDETIICSPGTSCRDQIEHTTGRRALHPIEVFAGAIGIRESK